MILKSRFARLRIRIAHRDFNRSEPWPEEWLLIEWPKGEQEPTKYWLSTLPENIGFARLVDLAKLRWRIERDYQELKQEVGLGHFEGARLARPPSSRNALHRSLRIPDLRTRDDSPLSTSLHRSLLATCRSRRLQTQRIRHCGLSVTFQIRSQPCAGGWPTRSSRPCNDARVADADSKTSIVAYAYDAVRLGV